MPESPLDPDRDQLAERPGSPDRGPGQAMKPRSRRDSAAGSIGRRRSTRRRRSSSPSKFKVDDQAMEAEYARKRQEVLQTSSSAIPRRARPSTPQAKQQVDDQFKKEQRRAQEDQGRDRLAGADVLRGDPRRGDQVAPGDRGQLVGRDPGPARPPGDRGGPAEAVRPDDASPPPRRPTAILADVARREAAAARRRPEPDAPTRGRPRRKAARGARATRRGQPADPPPGRPGPASRTRSSP